MEANLSQAGRIGKVSFLKKKSFRKNVSFLKKKTPSKKFFTITKTKNFLAGRMHNIKKNFLAGRTFDTPDIEEK